MQYEINPACYHQVFVLPKEIVEKHIKLAGALQLKVLLWLFYHQGLIENLDNISNDLGASPSDVQDALQYWIVNNIIKNAYTTAEPAQAIDVSVTKQPIAEVVMPTRTQKPNRAEIAKRGEESPEVAWLLCEAQNKFNRTLSFAESSTLVWIMDTYGLSPAVILMVVEYASSLERCNIRFIESTAIRWAKDEIDTVAKAEEYLTKLEQTRSEWNLICRVFGVDKRKPSKQEEIYISRWLREWKFSVDMLKAAYDQCVNNTGKISFPYINKVLDQWHSAGYKKPADIGASMPTNHSDKPKRVQRISQDKSTSYSMDDIESLI